MTNKPNEKYYWTLPYGARPEDSVVNDSPFFFLDGRHTYEFSTPDKDGELFWMKVKNIGGLLYPRFTTEDTILREFGVFQDGGTAVLLKAPIRNYFVEFLIDGGTRLSYTDARRRLGYILGWDHTTAAPPPDFERVNTLYRISQKWGRPNPFTFTVVRQNGVAYHIDCFPQTTDPQNDTGSPGAKELESTLRLSADKPTIYGQRRIFEDITGEIGAGNTEEPEVTPDLLFSILGQPFVYSSIDGASARTPFVFSMVLPLSVPLPTQLFSFGLYETLSGRWARFKYIGYPDDGWTIPAGYTIIEFNSEQQFFSISDGTDVISLDTSPSPQSDWNDFQFVPGQQYQFFMEINVGASSIEIGEADASISFRPRWAGI